MRYLLTAALLLTAASAHAGLLEFHGGEFTSTIHTNIAAPVTQTTELGTLHRGPQYSEFGYLGKASASVGVRDITGDTASMQLRANLESTWKLFAGEINRTNQMSMAGNFEFTTDRELKLNWSRTIPGPAFKLNGEPISFTRIPLTERESYFTMLPAGNYRVDFTASMPVGDMKSISTLSLSIPEPSSVVLLLGCVVAAVAAERYPLVLRSADERAGAV